MKSSYYSFLMCIPMMKKFIHFSFCFQKCPCSEALFWPFIVRETSWSLKFIRISKMSVHVCCSNWLSGITSFFSSYPFNFFHVLFLSLKSDICWTAFKLWPDVWCSFMFLSFFYIIIWFWSMDTDMAQYGYGDMANPIKVGYRDMTT